MNFNFRKSYKIWCSTIVEAEEFLNICEDNNIIWINSREPALNFLKWGKATTPVGFHITPVTYGSKSNRLSYSISRNVFDACGGKELSVSDILKRSSHTVFEPAKGNLTTLFEESIS